MTFWIFRLLKNWEFRSLDFRSFDPESQHFVIRRSMLGVLWILFARAFPVWISLLPAESASVVPIVAASFLAVGSSQARWTSRGGWSENGTRQESENCITAKCITLVRYHYHDNIISDHIKRLILYDKRLNVWAA